MSDASAGESVSPVSALTHGSNGVASTARVLEFDRLDLAAVRRFARECAVAAGFSADRADDAVLAVNEAVSNAVEHGGGRGTVRAWADHATLVFEVSDPTGRPFDASSELTPPDPDQPRGRGLWLMRHLTDLLEIHPGVAGSVVRMHLRL